MFFNVNFELRSKAQLVLGGDIIGDSGVDAYFGLVNINNFRVNFFFGNINNL